MLDVHNSAVSFFCRALIPEHFQFCRDSVFTDKPARLQSIEDFLSILVADEGM